MKYLLLALSFLFVFSTADAQRPPGKVKKAFARQFPDSENVKWSTDGEKQAVWTATFFKENDSTKVSYDYKANWTITLAFIEIDELPVKVSDAVKNEYQGSRMILAAKMQEPGFDGYGVAFLYKKERWGVAITKEGKVVRRKLTSTGFDF